MGQLQALHFSVTAEGPLHLSVIQLNICEVSDCQVYLAVGHFQGMWDLIV